MQSVPFYIFLFIHLVSLVVGFGAVLTTDFFGLLWVLAYKRVPFTLLMDTTHITQKLIWLGWFGLVCSGIGLLYLKGYVDNLTKVKLFFVLLVGLNGIYLHFINKAFEKLKNIEAKNIPLLLKFRITLGSFTSQLGWWGALFIGFIHRHIQHSFAWPANPYPYIIAIAGVLLIIAVVGETTLRKRQKQGYSKAVVQT